MYSDLEYEHERIVREEVDEFLSGKIDKDSHYYVFMLPIEELKKASSTNFDWVECEISEEKHKLAERTLVELVPVNPIERFLYGHTRYEYETFRAMVDEGEIVKGSGYKSKDYEWDETISKDFHLHHTGKILEKSKKK